MRTRPPLLAMAVAAVLATVLVPPAYAVAPVACGATLTSNTVLHRDLRCAGDGLSLAPGVTLDLGGHRLIGNGTGTAVTAVEATTNAIVNGTIRGWELGLRFESVLPFPQSPLKLDRVRLDHAPLDIAGGDVRLQRSDLRNSAVHLHYSTLRATHSALRSSSTDGELNQITLSSSTVTGGGVGLDENNTVTLVGSTLDGTGFAGSPVHCGGPIAVRTSTVKNYAQPIYGFADSCPLTVSDSTFRHNGVAISGDGLDIRRSTFRSNATGVLVTAGTPSSITGSTFRHHSGSGIFSETSGLTVGGNVAVRNGGYGIYAPAAHDLGDNRARFNTLDQCVGLVCGP